VTHAVSDGRPEPADDCSLLQGSSEASEAPSPLAPASTGAGPLQASMSLDISQQSEADWGDLQSEAPSAHESCESLKAATKQPAGTWRRLQATALAASRFARQAHAAAADRMQEAEHLAAQVHSTSIIPLQQTCSDRSRFGLQVEHCLEFSKGVQGGIEAASLQHLEHAVTAEAELLQVGAAAATMGSAHSLTDRVMLCRWQHRQVCSTLSRLSRCFNRQLSSSPRCLYIPSCSKYRRH
jgi:hypothetical protein